MFLRFRKSSYSDSHENCVEAAAILNFRKSSYSDSHDNCVEVAPIPTFHKSSYSTSDDNCVEVANLPTGAALRDSKRPEAGFLLVTAHEWGAFLAAVRDADL